VTENFGISLTKVATPRQMVVFRYELAGTYLDYLCGNSQYCSTSPELKQTKQTTDVMLLITHCGLFS
jgi:hypothetical protein